MREKIISILSDIQEKEAVENYASYCQRLLLEKTKDGKLIKKMYEKREYEIKRVCKDFERNFKNM